MSMYFFAIQEHLTAMFQMKKSMKTSEASPARQTFLVVSAGAGKLTKSVHILGKVLLKNNHNLPSYSATTNPNISNLMKTSLWTEKYIMYRHVPPRRVAHHGVVKTQIHYGHHYVCSIKKTSSVLYHVTFIFICIK